MEQSRKDKWSIFYKQVTDIETSYGASNMVFAEIESESKWSLQRKIKKS